MTPRDASVRENQLKDEVLRLNSIITGETMRQVGVEGRCGVQLREALSRVADAEMEARRAVAQVELFEGELERASLSLKCHFDSKPRKMTSFSWQLPLPISLVAFTRALHSSRSVRSLAPIYNLFASPFELSSPPCGGVRDSLSSPDEVVGALEASTALLLGLFGMVIAATVARAPPQKRSSEAQDLLDQVVLLQYDLSEAYRRQGGKGKNVGAGEGEIEGAGGSPLRGREGHVSDNSVKGTPSRFLDGSGSDLLEELEIEQQKRRKVEVLLSRETEARQKLEGDVEIGRARARDLERKVRSVYRLDLYY